MLAIDQTVEEKNGQKVVVGKTTTLELTPRQAEILAHGRQKGTLSLALRSIVDGAGKAEGGEDEDNGASGSQHHPLRRQPDTEVNRDRRDRHLKYGHQPIAKRTSIMAKRTLIRTASAAALIAMTGTALVGLADAADRGA